MLVALNKNPNHNSYNNNNNYNHDDDDDDEGHFCLVIPSMTQCDAGAP